MHTYRRMRWLVTLSKDEENGNSPPTTNLYSSTCNSARRIGAIAIWYNFVEICHVAVHCCRRADIRSTVVGIQLHAPLEPTLAGSNACLRHATDHIHDFCFDQQQCIDGNGRGRGSQSEQVSRDSFSHGNYRR